MKATKVPSSYDITSAIEEYQGMITHNTLRVTDHMHELNGCLEGGQLDRARELVMEIEGRVNSVTHYTEMIKSLRKDLA
jgi:hypothetical protein